MFYKDLKKDAVGREEAEVHSYISDIESELKRIKRILKLRDKLELDDSLRSYLDVMENRYLKCEGLLGKVIEKIDHIPGSSLNLHSKADSNKKTKKTNENTIRNNKPYNSGLEGLYSKKEILKPVKEKEKHIETNSNSESTNIFPKKTTYTGSLPTHFKKLVI
eukprot:GHVP01061808.1.p1 GENE.GHVP01061808.1~~GHVP01061808.1.p1  ORF type:complete len:163 (+),score=22.93 GHVP01061808.1:1253-1741(+)